MPPLVRVVQTCRACPSQWNAWDADGRYYYLRYRCGRGTVETAESPAGYVDQATPWPVMLVEFRHGYPLEGEIELGEFLELAGMTLAPDAEVIPSSRGLGRRVAVGSSPRSAEIALRAAKRVVAPVALTQVRILSGR